MSLILSRRLPVRFFLLVVAVLLVLPGLLFGGILLAHFSESERAETRAELLATAARIAQSVDRELEVLLMAARVLSTSERIEAGDLAAFGSEARAARRVLGRTIFLAAPDGHRIIDVASNHEPPLSAAETAQIRRAADERQPRVSNLLFDQVEPPQAFVLAPVVQGGNVVDVVGLSLDPAFFLEMLREQNLPKGWIATLRDANGRLVARTLGSERFLGTEPPTQTETGSADERIVATVTLDGVPALATTAPLHAAGWRVGVAVPSEIEEASVRRSGLWLALGGFAAMLLGILLAWQLARRISRPLSRLSEAGRDLGAERPVTLVESAISEVQDLSAALIGAQAQLAERSASLADERARLVAIIETVPVGLLIADASGTVVAGNRQLARMQLGGKGATLYAVDAKDAPVPEASMPLARALAGEDPAELRGRFRRADGTLFWAQAAAAPIAGAGGDVTGAVLAILDIDDAVRARQENERWAEQLEAEVKTRTAELEEINRQLLDEVSARGRAEDQLRQAQKMEAVGRLTGGIAHDFNNLLTVILGSLDLLRRRVTDGRALRLVDSAAESASRAADLIARLLAFSRRQPLLPQTVAVNELVSGMSSLLRRSLGETIAIDTVLDPLLWPALTDPNQLESALLNLAVNARDAILESSPGGGRLRIETHNVTIDPFSGPYSGEVRPGEYVMIATIDDGSGMSPETLAEVFEPFFTTKPHGKGTGLGLSQVHGFAVQSGGYVLIDSQLGRGTTVKLFLPRATQDVAAGALPGPPTALDAAKVSTTILVVEDEPSVRLFAAEALRLLGHEVLEAESGDHALDLLSRHPEIALMISDVVMPGMNGRELAREVERRCPDLPILLASGYNRAPEEPEDTRWDVLPKPFTVTSLAVAVNHTLEKQRDRVANGDPAALEDLRVDT